MFGDGRHPNIKQIFEQRLAPFMTQASYKFWEPRLWYFQQGLYYQGGMVRHTVFVIFMQTAAKRGSDENAWSLVAMCVNMNHAFCY